MCRAMEITYEEGRSDGLREGQSKGRMEGYVRSIRSLMRRRGISAEEAMDDLEILGDERIACVEQRKNFKNRYYYIAQELKNAEIFLEKQNISVGSPCTEA